MTENLPTTINYEDPEILKTLKETVAKGATDAEFSLFKRRCISTRLDPFKHELWFIKTDRGVQMMTGINGFYAIANSHPQYDGMTEPQFGKDDGGLYCRVEVYRKDRKYPQVSKLYDAEFNRHYGNWKTMPRYMLSKCCEAVALRKAFPQELNDLYTPEEMPREYSAHVEPVHACQVEAPKPAPVELSEPIFYDFAQAGLTQEQMDRLAKHCTYDEARGAWACRVDLGPKFEKFRVFTVRKEARMATEEDYAEAAGVDTDDLPESMGGAAEVDIPYAEKEEKVDHLKRIQERVRREKGKAA